MRGTKKGRRAISFGPHVCYPDEKLLWLRGPVTVEHNRELQDQLDSREYLDVLNPLSPIPNEYGPADGWETGI